MPAPISCSGLTAMVEAGTVGIIHHPWKSRVVAQAVKTDHRYVHKDPSICGGDPVIVGTRVPVRLIYQSLRAGDTIEAIQQAYPHLTLAQIHDALSYAYDHLTEIEDEICREDEAYRQGKAAQSK